MQNNLTSDLRIQFLEKAKKKNYQKIENILFVICTIYFYIYNGKLLHSQVSIPVTTLPPSRHTPFFPMRDLPP